MDLEERLKDFQRQYRQLLAGERQLREQLRDVRAERLRCEGAIRVVETIAKAQPAAGGG